MIRLIGSVFPEYEFSLPGKSFEGDLMPAVPHYLDDSYCEKVPDNAVLVRVKTRDYGWPCGECRSDVFVLMPQSEGDAEIFKRLSGIGIDVQRREVAAKMIIECESFGAVKRTMCNSPIRMVCQKRGHPSHVLFQNRLWSSVDHFEKEEWLLLIASHDEEKKRKLSNLVARLQPDKNDEDHLGAAGRAFRGSACTRLASYQTAPLTAYSAHLRMAATQLFDKVVQRVRGSKVKRYKGSFSILARSSSETVAKIIVYESRKGRSFGTWPALADGVYVLVRTNGVAGEALWKAKLRALSARELDRSCTLGIAPKHYERFAYFRITRRDGLEQIAEFLGVCADI